MQTDRSFPQPAFQFGMRQVVRHDGKPGTVIGRAEHAGGKPTYLVRPINSQSLTKGEACKESELVAF